MSGRDLIRLGPLLFALPAMAATRTLDAYLSEGRVQEGMVAFADAKDNSGRFSLALLQALDGLQQFSAGSGKLGVRREMVRDGLPFFRIMMPEPTPPPGANSGPAPVATPEKVAALFTNLRDSLKTANATLASVDAKEFKVRVNLSQARLDFNGDGVVAPDEMLMTKMGRVLGLPTETPPGQDLVIYFDSADAMWLKGYTHFLVGVLDVLLSYNWHPVWDQCAQVLFENPVPAPPLARFTAQDPRASFSHWADLIAALHDMRLEVKDKEGLAKAQQEFLATIACSRTCWQRVLAETDNDHEWLPSPKQTGPLGSRITQAQIDGWLKVLDELQAILEGKKLLPHWRLRPGIGISVPKLVASPPRLDLVLLIQGSALVPYLEEAPCSDQVTWRGLMEPFGPGFARFAIWSN
jgi:hypothetical protein